jgi:hypothetical protein
LYGRYALSGKFYVYVKILWFKFYPFEYYFPGGTMHSVSYSAVEPGAPITVDAAAGADDTGARVNEANWYLQGSFP